MTAMHEIVWRHFWKVTIVLLVVLALLWLAPRVRESPPPQLAPLPVAHPEQTAPAPPAPTLPAVPTLPAPPAPPEPPPPPAQRGKASFYGGSFDGRKTANGETYRQNSMTAAHRTLPMGSMVKVKNLKNGREVIVRINNRGPYIKGRVIDLSTLAATKLRMLDAGVVPVEITLLENSASLAKN